MNDIDRTIEALLPALGRTSAETVARAIDKGRTVRKPGTVYASTSTPDARVSVTIDGDSVPIPLENQTGIPLTALQRVMVMLTPPNGGYVAATPRVLPVGSTGDFYNLPVGMAVPWTHKTLPTGGAWEIGQAVLRSAYPRLNAFYSADGYPYGAGDGTTTFNLRDMRGRGHVGLDDMGGAAADAGRLASANTLGLGIGAETRVLLAGESGLVGHNHIQDQHRHLIFAVSDTVATGAQIRSRNTTGGSNFNSDFATATNQAVAAANATAAHNMMNPALMGLWVVRIG